MRSLCFYLLLLLLPWLSGALYAVSAAPPVLLAGPSPTPPGSPPSSRSPATPESNQIDFKPYIAAMQKRIRENWQAPQVPTAKRTVASFSIKRNGELFDLTIKQSSGDAQADAQALAAIRQAAPFEQLPAAYRESRINVQFEFKINVNPDKDTQSRTKLTPGDFPIKVWINSYFRSTEQLVPADVLAALRQGVLDWTRLLLRVPTDDSFPNYIFTLQKLSAEKQEQALLDSGIFMFATQGEQVDLKVEVVPQSQVLNGGGFFMSTEGQLGRIEIAAYGNGDEVREFYLRTVLIHEIGHALGLDHLSDQKCNFMSPDLYTCFSNEPQACRIDTRDTRCIAVRLDQVRPIEKLLLARSDEATKRTGGLTKATAEPVTRSALVDRQPTDTAAQTPVIAQLEFSPADRPLHSGDILRVNLVGTPQAKATFRIVNYTGEILMKELQPGRYEGLVQIGSRINIKDGTLQVLLINRNGKVSRNSDKKIIIASPP